MNIVWKDVSGRWYHATFVRPARKVCHQKQIYNINEVVGIDSYEHVSKKSYMKHNNINEQIGTNDFYVKFDENDVPKTQPKNDEWVCKSCVKMCKSKIVQSCSYYRGPNGGDSWSV